MFRPHNRNPCSSPIMKLVHRDGLSEHFTILTPKQFVDPNYFSSERFWITLYFGGESYYQGIGGKDNGDEALRRYLSTAGSAQIDAVGEFPEVEI